MQSVEELGGFWIRIAHEMKNILATEEVQSNCKEEFFYSFLVEMTSWLNSSAINYEEDISRITQFFTHSPEFENYYQTEKSKKFNNIDDNLFSHINYSNFPLFFDDTDRLEELQRCFYGQLTLKYDMEGELVKSKHFFEAEEDFFELFMLLNELEVIRILENKILDKQQDLVDVSVNKYPLVFVNGEAYYLFKDCILSKNNNLSPTNLSKFYDIFMLEGLLIKHIDRKDYFNFVESEFDFKIKRIQPYTSKEDTQYSQFKSIKSSFLKKYNLDKML